MKKFVSLLKLSVFSILIIQLLLFSFFSFFIRKQTLEDIKELRKEKELDLIKLLNTRVNAAYDIFSYNLKNSKNAAKSIEKSCAIIKNFEYEEGSYIWVHEILKENINSAFMLLHPNKSLENKSYSDVVDFDAFSKISFEGKIYNIDDPVVSKLKRTDIFKEFNSICLKKGEGVVSYYWPKIVDGVSSEAGYKKISYVKYFKPENIVIGCGAYADHIDSLMVEQKTKLILKQKKLIFNLILILGILSFLLIMILIRYQKRFYKRQISFLKNEIDQKNKVTALLKEKEKELGFINNNLEKLVEKRTIDLQKSYNEQVSLNKIISDNQEKLIINEKMVSLGQLAAGVAHEINNPIGFIISNISSLESYFNLFVKILNQYKCIENMLEENSEDINIVLRNINELKSEEDYDFILEDVPVLLRETSHGADRVKQIVLGLKMYSHGDDDVVEDVNINECLDMSKRMVWNELKYHCSLEEDLGDIPLIKGNFGKLNQVFMNLLVNSAHAIKESGLIKVLSYKKDKFVVVEISDDGAGIPKENINKIFDPFYTTKPIGKGTGLGLSISNKIIAEYKGEIKVESEVGKGTSFIIKFPIPGVV